MCRRFGRAFCQSRGPADRSCGSKLLRSAKYLLNVSRADFEGEDHKKRLLVSQAFFTTLSPSLGVWWCESCRKGIPLGGGWAQKFIEAPVEAWRLDVRATCRSIPSWLRFSRLFPNPVEEIGGVILIVEYIESPQHLETGTCTGCHPQPFKGPGFWLFVAHLFHGYQSLAIRKGFSQERLSQRRSLKQRRQQSAWRKSSSSRSRRAGKYWFDLSKVDQSVGGTAVWCSGS